MDWIEQVLHVSPEAAVGGPLALVKTGDRIRLSVAQRSINLIVDVLYSLIDPRIRYG